MMIPISIAYASAINLGSYALFWYDKEQALQKKWRVPEKTLQLSALLGGWAGGMAAMKHFRHKTVKEPFRTIYFSATAINIGCIASLLLFKKNLRQLLLSSPPLLKPSKRNRY